MNDSLQALTAGTLVIIILKLVFDYIKSRRNGKSFNGQTSGDKAVEFWQHEIERIVRESFTSVLLPEIQRQTKVLEAILEEQRKLSNDMAVFLELQKRNSN